MTNDAMSEARILFHVIVEPYRVLFALTEVEEEQALFLECPQRLTWAEQYLFRQRCLHVTRRAVALRTRAEAGANPRYVFGLKLAADTIEALATHAIGASRSETMRLRGPDVLSLVELQYTKLKERDALEARLDAKPASAPVRASFVWGAAQHTSYFSPKGVL